jgi:hypothetical protein
MAEDTLARERQLNNLIDEVRRQGEEIERLKRLVMEVDTSERSFIVPEPATGGRWRLYAESAGTADGMTWLVMEEIS